MISPQLLEILRCPLDPSATRLDLVGDGLVCQRCRLRFPIEKGFPRMLVEEAELPPGCASWKDLPCQQSAKSTPETA
jgi:uncharacterized protein YbaR (Trm112 family)